MLKKKKAWLRFEYRHITANILKAHKNWFQQQKQQITVHIDIQTITVNLKIINTS